MFDSNLEPKLGNAARDAGTTGRGAYFLTGCLALLALAAGYLILDLSGHRIDFTQINEGKVEFPQK